MKLIFFITTFLSLSTYSEESKDPMIQPEDIWVLDTHSSRFSGNGQVLYMMPQDALHTYRGREYGDWNQFSYIDSRKLVRLCLLYTSPSPRDAHESRMPSSA